MSTAPSFSIVNTLSLLIAVGYIAAVPLWMWYPPTNIPPETLAIINQMMGAFGMAFATVINFHIGSSRSSKDKDDAQNQVITNLTGTGNGKVITPAVIAAAEKAAPAAAAAAAPAAAAVAAPPAAEAAAPPAVDAELDRRGIADPHEPPKP